MTDERCPWSDLPRGSCDHCTPGHRPHTRDIPTENIALTIVRREHIELPRTGRALPEELSEYRLYDYVSALCDWTISVEPHEIETHHRSGSTTTYVTRHITTAPPLILQLWQAAEGSRGLDVGNKSFGSQPSARLEALDVANDIEREVHRILRHQHGLANSHDTYPETITAVRHLGSVATSEDARTIRRWWATARVVTGWDKPAFKPDNTCPLCGRRGTLRIKLPTAFCVECRSHWDEVTLGLLSEHIRTENHEDDDTQDQTANAV